MLVSLNPACTLLIVEWSKDHISRWHVKWIRHNCQCERCFRKFPGNYTVVKESLDKNMVISSALLQGEEIYCNVDKDIIEEHTIRLPIEFLRKYCNCDGCLDKEISRRDIKVIDPCQVEAPRMKYEEVLSDKGLFQCLQQIITYGFSVIEDFPTHSQEPLRKFVRSIGPIHSTNYGEIWELVNQPDPMNDAFTTNRLPIHQDQTYMEQPPGVQFLFAARFDQSVQGGESVVVDMIRVAEMFRQEHPKHYRTLCRVPCIWETKDFCRDDPAWLEHSKTHIEEDYFGKIVAVNWSPGVEGVLRIREDDCEAYYEAFDAFMEMLNNAKNHFKLCLQTGEMIIINNRRMGHSRESFYAPTARSRTMWGCYCDLDALRSKYQVLARKLGVEVAPPKVGNRSSF